MSSYRVRELDKYGEVVYDAADSDAGAEKNTAVFSVRDDKGRTIDASFNVSYEDADDSGNFVINNKLNPAAPDADPGPFAIKLTIDDGRYGKAEITVNNSFFNRTKAYAGDTVKVRVRPRGTYSPYVYVLSTEDGSLVEEMDLTGSSGAFTGTFEMPRFPVTVSVKFKDAGDGGGSGKGSKGNGSINTGDEAHMGLWLTIAILAALELAVLTVMRRRRSRRTE